MSAKSRMLLLATAFSSSVLWAFPGLSFGSWNWSTAKAFQDKGLEPEGVLQDWPQASRLLAGKLIEQYGRPSEVTIRRLTWNLVGPWKRVTVYESPGRYFVEPRKGMLEETVSFAVPGDKALDVGRVSEQISVHLRQRELSSRSDSEALNFLALNLAHDVALGTRDVQDARAFFARVAELLPAGKSSPYAEKLLW